jgi:hypothetical protein
MKAISSVTTGVYDRDIPPPNDEPPPNPADIVLDPWVLDEKMVCRRSGMIMDTP